MTVTVTDDTTETFTGMVDAKALTYNYKLQKAGISDDVSTTTVDESDQDISGILGFSNDGATTRFDSDTTTGLGTKYELIIEAKVNGKSTSEKDVFLESFDTTFNFDGLFKFDSKTTVSFGDEINSATSSQLLRSGGLIRATGATLDKLSENSGDSGISSAQSSFTELFTISGLTIDEAKAKLIGDKKEFTFTADTNIYDTVMSVRTNDNAEIKSLNEIGQTSTQAIDADKNVTIHEAYSEFKEQGTTLYSKRTIGTSGDTSLIRDGSVVDAKTKWFNDGTFETQADQLTINQVSNSKFKIMSDTKVDDKYVAATSQTISGLSSSINATDIIDANSIIDSGDENQLAANAYDGWKGTDSDSIEFSFKVKVLSLIHI